MSRPPDLMEPCEQGLITRQPLLHVGRNVHTDNTIVDVNGALIGGSEVVVMAGPCAVESREMVLEIADRLHRLGVTILRGGAFKPRTSPYSFRASARRA